jgi:peroxiredoxin
MRTVAGGQPGTGVPAQAQRPPRERATAARGGGAGDGQQSGASVTLLAMLVGVGLTAAACLGGKPAIPDGQAAHAFSLPPLLNATSRISLRSYQGQPVVLNFCAAWSPPCTAETKLLATYYRLHPAGKVAIITIESLDSRAAALSMLRAGKVGYPVADDPTQSVGGKYGVPGIPTTYFLNAQHQIVKTNLGWLSWKKLTHAQRIMDAGA